MSTITNSDRLSRLWLLIGLFCIVAAIGLWLFFFIEAPKTGDSLLKGTSEDQVVARSNLFPSSFGEMINLVPPYQVQASKAMMDKHLPEMKTRSEMLLKGKLWTVEVLNVSNQDVIISYLTKKKDRENFQVFKYKEPGKEERYILTYGGFSTVQAVDGAIKQYNFELPSSVKLQPKRFDEYLNYVVDEGEQGQGLDNALRKVHTVNLIKLNEVHTKSVNDGAGATINNEMKPTTQPGQSRSKEDIIALFAKEAGDAAEDEKAVAANTTAEKAANDKAAVDKNSLDKKPNSTVNSGIIPVQPNVFSPQKK